MKFGQLSKENSATGESGFLTSRWFIGLGIIFIAGIGHALMLPFADISLLMCNTATAITTSSLLAIFCLGEKFNLRYDLTAFILIITGSVLNIIQTNKKSEKRDYAEITKLVTKPSSIVFFMFTILVHCISVSFIFWLTRRTREFEADCRTWLTKRSHD